MVELLQETQTFILGTTTRIIGEVPIVGTAFKVVTLAGALFVAKRGAERAAIDAAAAKLLAVPPSLIEPLGTAQSGALAQGFPLDALIDGVRKVIELEADIKLHRFHVDGIICATILRALEVGAAQVIKEDGGVNLAVPTKGTVEDITRFLTRFTAPGSDPRTTIDFCETFRDEIPPLVAELESFVSNPTLFGININEFTARQALAILLKIKSVSDPALAARADADDAALRQLAPSLVMALKPAEAVAATGGAPGPVVVAAGLGLAALLFFL